MLRTKGQLSRLKIRNLLITVLILVSAIIGQQDGCSDLNIKSTDGHWPWLPFEASLVLTEQQRSLIRDVRWSITKHNTSTNKKEFQSVANALSVVAKAWDANEPGYITWLVVARLGDCVSAGVSSSTVLPNPGTPVLLDQFGELPGGDEKGRLDIAIAEMIARHRDEELFVFAEFSARTAWKARRLKLKRMLDHMVGVRRFDAKRITFVISEGAETRIRLQPVSQQQIEAIAPNGSMTIPGERFSDFVNFFK